MIAKLLDQASFGGGENFLRRGDLASRAVVGRTSLEYLQLLELLCVKPLDITFATQCCDLSIQLSVRQLCNHITGIQMLADRREPN